MRIECLQSQCLALACHYPLIFPPTVFRQCSNNGRPTAEINRNQTSRKLICFLARIVTLICFPSLLRPSLLATTLGLTSSPFPIWIKQIFQYTVYTCNAVMQLL